MKIIDVQTFGVNLGDGNHVFVKILTDEHLHGIGEAYRCGPDHAVEEAVHYFKDWILGLDPTRIEYIWRLLYNGSRFPGGSILNAAISGIEIACWDLKGKALGVPVYELIGGRCRDRVRVYLGVSGSTPREVADSAKRAQDLGFTAVKMAPHPPNAEKLPWDQVLRGTAARLAAVRKAVGDDMDVGLDPHARIFEPVRALQMAQAVEPYRSHVLRRAAPAREHRGHGEAAPEDPRSHRHRRDALYQVRVPGRDRGGSRRHSATGPAALRRAHGGQEDRRHGRGRVSDHRPAQPAGSRLHGRVDPLCRLDAQLHHSGVPGRQPGSHAEPDPGAHEARVDGYLELPQDPGLGIELNEKAFAGNPLKKWHRPFVIEPDGNIAYQ